MKHRSPAEAPVHHCGVGRSLGTAGLIVRQPGFVKQAGERPVGYSFKVNRWPRLKSTLSYVGWGILLVWESSVQLVAVRRPRREKRIT